MYKGKVSVPPLLMVDDILTVQKCGATSGATNSEVNAFIEQKCFKIHKGPIDPITYHLIGLIGAEVRDGSNTVQYSLLLTQALKLLYLT